MKKFLLFIILTFSFVGSGQTLGDYRSKTFPNVGEWNSAASWEKWDGSSWVSATEYPGQTGSIPTAAVTIQAGSTISFSTPTGTPGTPTSYLFGDLIINGILNIGADINGNWYVGFPGTQSILISQGTLFLQSKSGASNLYLPTGATFFIVNGGRIAGEECNNNKNVYIGNLRYAACAGSGQTYTEFGTMNSTGGSLRARPVSSQAICGNSGSTTISSENEEGGMSYQWTVPSSGVTWSSGPNLAAKTLGTVSFATQGAYTFTLTVTLTKKIGGTNYNLIDTHNLVVYVGQPNTVTTASAKPSVCVGAAISNVTHNTTVANGINQSGIPGANGLPPGVVAYWAQNKITISGTPTAVGIYNYSIPLTGGCGTVAATGTITVNAKPNISAMAAAACSANVFNVTPVNGTNGVVPPVISYSWSAPTMPAGLTGGVAGSGTFISGTLTNSTGGPLSAVYTVTPSSASCGTGNPFTVTVSVGGNSTFTAIGWSNGVPSNTTNAVIASNYSTDAASISACNCEVKNGAVLTVTEGKYVEIKNNIINNGQIVVESDGNLIQRNDGGTYSGTGVFTLKRNSQMKRLDYTYWGTPVDKQQLKAFSPLTVASRFYSYNEQDDSFSTIPNISGTSMVPGKGYVIRAPDNFSATSTQTFVGTYAQTGTFTARPNNGIISVGVTKAGPGKNLLGNPYPSNIELNKLKEDNSALTGTFYFWTNYATWTGNTGGVGTVGNYNGNGYAAWNGTGGVRATTATGSATGPEPTNIVKPGQGFLAEVNSAGTVQFKNRIRTSDGITAPFFNKNINSTENTDSTSRFWLAITTPIATTNTILIGYIDGASNGYDPGFDAVYPSDGNDQFYSQAADKKLLIQGRQFPFDSSDIIQLGVKHFMKGNYTIALPSKEGMFNEGQAIYLNDKLTGIITNLQKSSYEYFSEAGEFNSRFEVSFVPQAHIALATDVNLQKAFKIYLDGEYFVVDSAVDSIRYVEVYDAVGRLLITVPGNNARELRLFSAGLLKGIYVLKAELTSGVTRTAKIRN